MPDRVPIGTHPGLTVDLLDQDLILAPAAATPYTITKLFLRRFNDDTAALTAKIQNATGGAATGFSVTIDAGSDNGTADNTLAIDAEESVYLRVTACTDDSSGLSGWFEMESAAGVSASTLTTLAKVKRYAGITATTNDTLLDEIIAGVSQKMIQYMGSGVVSETISSEKHSGGSDYIILRRYPAASLVVVEDGNTLTASEYELDEDVPGKVWRVNSSGDVTEWNGGLRDVAVTYSAGYATVPDDVSLAATVQARYEYFSSPVDQGRLGTTGTVLDEGGSANYLTQDWAPGVERAMRKHRIPRAS